MSRTTEIQQVKQVAVEASPAGILVCDEEGRILFANPQVASIFGYVPGELLGAPVDLLLPGRSRTTHRAERERSWGDAALRPMGAARELLGLRKDGTEVPVEICLRLVKRSDRRLVIASVVDVTQRRQREQRIRKAVAERLGFEQVVSELAAQFVNLPIERTDEAIVDGQRRIVEALGIDRTALLRMTDGGEDLISTHIWSRPEFPAPPPRVSARESFPWILSRIQTNEPVWIESLSDVLNPVDRENLARVGTKAAAVIPLGQGGEVVGAISFAALLAERTWLPAVRDRLRLLAAVFSQALARRKNEEQLRGALDEVERLRNQVALENQQLRIEVKALKGPQTIAAESNAARRVLAQVETVAGTDATVLLLGETGCGKEVFAQAIHDFSGRRGRPMVRVNCAAIPTPLIESELFGRERGAYTGALSRQVGRFELADGSTLLLDEIGDLPLEAQAKLLRVVQDKVVERLGSHRSIKVDVRVIAATNRDLGKAVADRTFREDLFYRLNVFPITVPPLRERPEDIPVLVWTFIDEFSRAFNKKIDSISRADLAALQRHAWPGNVRELRNVIERAVIVANGPRLTVGLPRVAVAAGRESLALSDVETEHIRSVLDRVGWRVRGPGGAAELLGMKPTTLDSRMAKLGIGRPRG